MKILSVDTSSSNNEDSKHVYIGDLKNEIPVSLRDRIYCMHINDNICIFTKNNSLCSHFHIKRVKFSRIKFSKNEINLIKLFYSKNIKEIYFISCKFSKYSIELLSQYFNKNENNITHLIFNDCEINI